MAAAGRDPPCSDRWALAPTAHTVMGECWEIYGQVLLDVCPSPENPAAWALCKVLGKDGACSPPPAALQVSLQGALV